MTRIKYLGAAIAAVAFAVGIPAVTASPAMAANEKCMDFSTPTVGGKTASINVCWNWVSNGRGAYDGRVWGKFYDPYTNNGKIYLQARVEPDAGSVLSPQAPRPPTARASTSRTRTSSPSHSRHASQDTAAASTSIGFADSNGAGRRNGDMRARLNIPTQVTELPLWQRYVADT
ncbi:hypothetical protein [Nocardia sp. XZ_19_231]|uniref:hypothetical protein n=1 Tax=Nocardia sp. XZ_19_231 TaxID=2769252 RepID=UPI00188F54B3|nr:hypothetical protein [Nocardia sp. XZ_19_231]